MNICYINPTNNIRRPIAELSNILSEKGHNITILYPESNKCPTKNWVANDAIKNGKIKLIPIKSYYFAPLRYSFPNILQLIKETRKVFKQNHKIHIWEYFYPLSIIPILYSTFSRRKRKKTILTTDGFVGYSYKPKEPRWLVPAFKLYTNLFARFLFKIPKTMTTYGNPMIPYAKKAKVPLKKLRVLPTGIHLERFQNINQDKITKLKEEFCVKEDEKIIIFVGMLTERKGVDKVIKISQRLLSENYNIKTLIVGDAHGENIYEKLVNEKYKDKIIFVGGRKDIPEFMSLADVLLLPSEGEGLPGVVMEAMASGLPVVATNEGCTPDLIDDLPRTDEEYYLSVKKILLEKINTIQKNMDKIKNFEWEIVAKKYENLYQE